MKIEVHPYIEDGHKKWNEFVTRANNGTLFHRLDFLDYHPDDQFNEHHLEFYYKGENLIGVMPLAIEEEGDQTVARSPYGGSYGGIVSQYDLPFRYADDMVTALLDYLRDLGVDRVRIRPTPREQQTSPSCYQEYHYYASGLEIADREVTCVADLGRVEEEVSELYESRCRRAVQKARRKGVTVNEDVDNIQAFHEMLVDTLDRHGKRPTHSLDDLERLFDLVPDKLRLSLATLEGDPIAGTLSFHLNDNTNVLFYNCHRSTYREYNPLNLLIDTELRWSLENGYRYLDFGTGVEENEWSEGVVKFKESFGATGHFRTVYERDL
jgi:hypothetical protein